MGNTPEKLLCCADERTYPNIRSLPHIYAAYVSNAQSCLLFAVMLVRARFLAIIVLTPYRDMYRDSDQMCHNPSFLQQAIDNTALFFQLLYICVTALSDLSLRPPFGYVTIIDFVAILPVSGEIWQYYQWKSLERQL